MARLRSMLGGGSSNYAYVAARVRAMKTHLLPPETYPKMMARDVHEIARVLQEGRYKEDVDALAGRYAGARLVELATRRNQGHEYQRILSWCNGGARAIVAAYLERYDVFDAKTVLRGVASGASFDEVRENLVPGGTVQDEVFEQATNAATLEDAVDVLAGQAALSALMAVRGQPLSALENALDRAYYARLAGAAQAKSRAHKALQSFIRREIDIVNLKAVLRLKASGVTEYDPVPGGMELDGNLCRRVLGAQPVEVSSILDATAYGAAVKEPLAQWVQDGDLNPVVTALEKYHLATAQEFSHLYPLSVLPVVDYVLRKRVEVDNLRVIAVGKATGLDDDTIRGLVMT